MIVLCVRCRRSSAVNSTKSSSTLIYDVRTSGYWVFNKDRTVSDLGHPAPVFPYQTSLHPSAVVALCYRFDCGVDPKNNIKKIFTFVSCRVDSVGGEWKWSHTSVPKKQNTHTHRRHTWVRHPAHAYIVEKREENRVRNSKRKQACLMRVRAVATRFVFATNSH